MTIETLKLKPEFKKRWVEALRSGKYKQGSNGYLKVIEDCGSASHCCLGVACELLVEEGNVSEFMSRESVSVMSFGLSGRGAEEKSWCYPTSGIYGLMFEDTQKAIGLSPEGVKLDVSVLDNKEDDLVYPKSGASLPVLNDSGQYSFNDLADIIEKHL